MSEQKCGCSIALGGTSPAFSTIIYCPIHAAAEETAKERDDMRAMLKRLEWEGDSRVDVCPCCDVLKSFTDGKHEPDCELAALLARTEGR